MIFTTYLLYKLYADKCNKEGFEGTTQSLGGVDDTNAINTLAQIAKNLMAGGVTVPGAMTVNGDVTTGALLSKGPSASLQYFSRNGNGKQFTWYTPDGDNSYLWHTDKPNLFNITKNGDVITTGNLTVSGNGSIATGGAPGQAKGTIISNMGDSWGMLWGSECALIGQKGKPMRFGFADAYNAAGWDEKMRVQPDGSLIVAGRNILAELNNLNAKVAHLNLGGFKLTDEGGWLTIRHVTGPGDNRYAFRAGGNVNYT